MTELKYLPKAIQKQVKKTLRAYSDCLVVFENGRYSVGGGVTIKAHYADDHEVIGNYRADEVYTETEITENYINEFHDYPMNYKGNRDYQLLKDLDLIRIFCCECGENEERFYGYINEQGNFELPQDAFKIIELLNLMKEIQKN